MTILEMGDEIEFKVRGAFELRLLGCANALLVDVFGSAIGRNEQTRHSYVNPKLKAPRGYRQAVRDGWKRLTFFRISRGAGGNVRAVPDDELNTFSCRAGSACWSGCMSRRSVRRDSIFLKPLVQGVFAKYPSMVALELDLAGQLFDRQTHACARYDF
jgi:hypothetical protein